MAGLEAGLPPDTRVGRVRLQVADLDRSLGFYRDVIGLTVLDRDDGTARLGAGDPEAGHGPPTGDPARLEDDSRSDPGHDDLVRPVLLELVEHPGARPVPRTGLMGIYHFALLLPDRPTLGRFLRHHARQGTRFGAADHAFSEALYLEDPDGITIEVYRDRPREEWPGVGRPEEAPGSVPDAGAPEASAPSGSSRLPLVSDPLDGSGLMAAAGEAEWAGVPPGAVVGHMHFFVDDLDAAGRFYVDGLGFQPMINHPSALFVAAGGYHHHVGLNTWRAGAPTAGPDHAGLLDWELILPGAGAVEAAARRLEAAGFDVDRDRAEGRDDRRIEDGDDDRDDDRYGPDRRIRAEDPWGIRVVVTG